MKRHSPGARLGCMSPRQTTGGVEAKRIVWTISRRLGMVIVLALAFVLSATLTVYVLFRSGDTRVPDLAGKREAEARALAESAGLRVRIQKRADAEVPAETVIETRPAANSSLKRDSSVTIVVSTGPPSDRSGLDRDDRPRPERSGAGDRFKGSGSTT